MAIDGEDEISFDPDEIIENIEEVCLTLYCIPWLYNVVAPQGL